MPCRPELWHRQIAHITHPVRQILSRLAVEHGDTILDVGCGTCTDYEHFKNFKVNYHGVDVTPKFVKTAHDTFKVPCVTVADAYHLPFRTGSFDVAYCKDLLEHLPPDTWQNVVAELFRVASMMVMLVFFREPTSEPVLTCESENIGYYSKEQNRVVEYGFYYNRYNEQDVLTLLKKLGAKKIDVLRDIRNLEHHHSNAQTIIVSHLR
jgi:ubiquinone/menaquinone biosynthesis C-methylase UbiE